MPAYCPSAQSSLALAVLRTSRLLSLGSGTEFRRKGLLIKRESPPVCVRARASTMAPSATQNIVCVSLLGHSRTPCTCAPVPPAVIAIRAALRGTDISQPRAAPPETISLRRRATAARNLAPRAARWRPVRCTGAGPATGPVRRETGSRGMGVKTSDSHRSDFRLRYVHCKGCPARAHHIETTP